MSEMLEYCEISLRLDIWRTSSSCYPWIFDYSNSIKQAASVIAQESCYDEEPEKYYPLCEFQNKQDSTKAVYNSIWNVNTLHSIYWMGAKYGQITVYLLSF